MTRFSSFKGLALAVAIGGMLAGTMLGASASKAQAEQTNYTCDTPSTCKAGAYTCTVVCSDKCRCTVG